MKKLILYVALIFTSLNLFAASPQEIYNRLVRANGFASAPKLVIINSNQVQAANTGSKILLYKGMLRAVRNDDELAAVLGHELAHGKLGHRGSTHRNEYAADSLGMVYMSRAGFNRCRGAKILLKLNKATTKTHPAAKDRYSKVSCRKFV